ncbi:MAG: methionyl-tRNA formyltransferase [Patescibacteria group bacterium]|jgi:methionyl-tRNA formyltransferase|nr:methionyl-tRNA formyltransferase [Patescibacteria group bacterium]
MNKKLKIIFMGTPDFAVPTLEKLIQHPNIEVLAVFAQADKAAGRGQKLHIPPTKQLALEHNIPVFQPEKIKSAASIIENLQPDVIVVIAYGKIIPQTILDIPRHGCINIHASLLPKYRGASCLQATILNGDTESGVTVMKMDASMDTGPIIKQASIVVANKELLVNLHDKLAQLGAQTLIEVIFDYCLGNIKTIAQDDSKATYVPLIKKEDGLLNPNLSALELERRIRAFNPWPGSYLILNNDEKLKILAADAVDIAYNEANIGEFFVNNKNLHLKCGQNYLHILKLQRENRKALMSSEFLKGNQDILNLKAI